MIITGMVGRVRAWGFTPKTGKDAGVEIKMVTLGLLEDSCNDPVTVELKDDGTPWARGDEVFGTAKGYKFDGQENLVFRMETLRLKLESGATATASANPERVMPITPTSAAPTPAAGKK